MGKSLIEVFLLILYILVYSVILYLFIKLNNLVFWAYE